MTNAIVRSNNVNLFAATSDNEAAIALAVDLMTNFVGSVMCIVHTLALAVNDVFKDEESQWSVALQYVNYVTTYFNQHPAACQLLVRKQLQRGISADRVTYLHHDFQTRWYSKLNSFSHYMSLADDIDSVAKEMQIPDISLVTLNQAE